MIINHGKNKSINSRSHVISDINITPFVDVLLVLLIIFMVTAPIVTGGLNLNLPEGAEAQSQKNDLSVTLSLKEDGSLFVNDEKIDIETIDAYLHKQTSRNFDYVIYLKADKRNDYGKVMETIKRVNLAGFKQIVLVTKVDS
jgi:biopolymer transport protein TolR